MPKPRSAKRRTTSDRGRTRARGRAGGALGLGLAAVVNLFNPELLVLAGGCLALPGYRTAALESAERHTLPDLWSACAMRDARSGEAAAALGAARAGARTSPAPA